ncbi:hypothetical protein KAK07_23560 [Ideonella sp. 4Y16]|uniref:Uncharacterized protein n=1 Tax=Ideonella aquatica TaxID=2824119 RepID=A0A940YHZ1_9BURK|nr:MULTISPECIES: hypothetical protein [Ideonella]MBQ0946337.1 hypothetical protein [Ideonella alba]MBQ0960455.1 hypothetical protein [Ideonella aquatica]
MPYVFTPPAAFEWPDIWLRQDMRGRFYFLMEPIRAAAEACGIPEEDLDRQTATTIAAEWYRHHLRHGGRHFPLADRWLADLEAQSDRTH